MSLIHEQSGVTCNDCARSFGVDDGLQAGDLCPSDDCPSNESVIFSVIAKINKETQGDGIPGIGASAAISAMTGYWKTLQALGEHPNCIDEDIANLITKLESVRKEMHEQIDCAIASQKIEALGDLQCSVANEICCAIDESRIGFVLMSDLVDEYDTPESILEWQWIERNASFSHVQNGQSGVWEFMLNLSCDERFIDMPENLVSVVATARNNSLSYLIFHQGT